MRGPSTSGSWARDDGNDLDGGIPVFSVGNPGTLPSITERTQSPSSPSPLPSAPFYQTQSGSSSSSSSTDSAAAATAPLVRKSPSPLKRNVRFSRGPLPLARQPVLRSPFSATLSVVSDADLELAPDDLGPMLGALSLAHDPLGDQEEEEENAASPSPGRAYLFRISQSAAASPLRTDRHARGDQQENACAAAAACLPSPAKTKTACGHQPSNNARGQLFSNKSNFAPASAPRTDDLPLDLWLLLDDLPPATQTHVGLGSEIDAAAAHESIDVPPLQSDAKQPDVESSADPSDSIPELIPNQEESAPPRASSTHFPHPWDAFDSSYTLSALSVCGSSDSIATTSTSPARLSTSFSVRLLPVAESEAEAETSESDEMETEGETGQGLRRTRTLVAVGRVAKRRSCDVDAIEADCAEDTSRRAKHVSAPGFSTTVMFRSPPVTPAATMGPILEADEDETAPSQHAEQEQPQDDGPVAVAEERMLVVRSEQAERPRDDVPVGAVGKRESVGVLIGQLMLDDDHSSPDSHVDSRHQAASVVDEDRQEGVPTAHGSSSGPDVQSNDQTPSTAEEQEDGEEGGMAAYPSIILEIIEELAQTVEDWRVSRWEF